MIGRLVEDAATGFSTGTVRSHSSKVERDQRSRVSARERAGIKLSDGDVSGKLRQNSAAKRAEENISERNYFHIHVLDAVAVRFLILALGVLGAITHQAMAAAPAAGILTRFRAVPAAGYATAVCVLYVFTFFVGSYIYTRYRVAIRIPLEDAYYFKTLGFFDFKEHIATLGLVLLPAYWYFWKNAQDAEYDNARKGVTLVLAVMVWFLFIVGHVLNNTRGFAS